MPRPVHALGRPGTEVIPHDWSAHHRPVVAKTFGAGGRVNAPGTGTPVYDPETGLSTVPPGVTRYSGPMRIQVKAAQDRTALAAEQEVTSLAYLVALDHAAAGIEPDDLVTVEAVDDNGDPSLVGRVLTVRAVGRGTEHWQRNLTCTDDLG